MEMERLNIGAVPALRLGAGTRGAYLFVHGKLGNKEEAVDFARRAEPAGYQVVSMDLPGHGERRDSGERLVPRTAVPGIRAVYDFLKARWDHICLRANSIGAWLAMEALQEEALERALFVSPVTDMEGLIQTMMDWAGVTRRELERRGEIPTEFGETLSWEYLNWVQANPVAWRVPTAILYGERDTLLSRRMLNAFLGKTAGRLTVVKNGEHWFHTPVQMAVLQTWEETNV